MKLHPARTVFLLVSSLISSEAAADDLAQQLPDGVVIEAPTQLMSQITSKGCTFYENAGGGGESWTVNVEWKNANYPDQVEYSQALSTVGEWWDDRISSLRCDESEKYKCSVSLYRDNNKAGGDIILWGSQGLINLDQWGWDDTASSLQIFCTEML